MFTVELSFLPSLGARYPDLSKVDLRGDLEPVVLQSFLAFLSNLNRVGLISIARTDPGILQYLARLPPLKHPAVGERFYHSTPCSNLNHLTANILLYFLLTSLEELSLPFANLDISTTILDVIEHRGLVSLTLIFPSALPDSRAIRRLYVVITSTHVYSTLKSLGGGQIL